MSSVGKRRADQALVDLGLAESRSRAQALIMAGKVWSGDARIGKPGDLLAADAAAGSARPGPSLGVARRPEARPRARSISACRRRGWSASTSAPAPAASPACCWPGGAARVHAVDVGHGQLAWSLRTDPRVVVHERVNARYLTREIVPEPIEALVCDASFIGLATVLPAPLALCAPGAWAVALIKPQFEAGPAGRQGRRRARPGGHRAVCARDREWWSRPAELDGDRHHRQPDHRARRATANS